jgi:hypothetical protein
MTSEAKIAANRRNAQRSTGPRTKAGKARVRRNALRHGLAAVVVGDPPLSAEAERIAAAICGEEAAPLEREQAMVVAEAQTTLKQIRRARAQIIEQLSQQPPSRLPSQPPNARARNTNSRDDAIRKPSLGHLLRLERYERRACSRRKRALTDHLA